MNNMALKLQKENFKLFSALNDKQKQIIFERFGLGAGVPKTLEAIGNGFGLTRERVRQIVESSLKKMRELDFPPAINKAFLSFKTYLKVAGGLKKEEILFSDFAISGRDNSKNWLAFLLTLGGFCRFGETEDFYAFWSLDAKILSLVQKTLILLNSKLKKSGKPLVANGLGSDKGAAKSILEISKNILKTRDGKYGLKEWPEVNPKGVRDLALLVLRKTKKPLHFVAIANLIDRFLLENKQPGLGVISASALAFKKTNYQTVHNELIRDPQFILVGRGLYALNEWGFKAGTVKDVIADVLKDAKQPLSQKEIMKKVLSQRLVKESTILLNLGNKQCFLRSENGHYSLREA